MSKKKKYINEKTLALLQCIATMVFIFCLVRLNMLPTLYLIPIVVLLLFVLVGLYQLMHHKKSVKYSRVKRPSKRSVVGKIMSIFLSVILLLASLYIIQGDGALNKITGSNKQVQTISAIVLKDSKIKNLKDLDDTIIGYNDKTGFDYIQSTLEELKKDVAFSSEVKYSDFLALSDALYEKEIEVLLINESYRSIIEDSYPTFSADTKIVYTFEIVEEIDVSVLKKVDVTKDVFSIYVSGIDTYGNVATVSRSDVNMIVTVNPKTRKILLTSIPRDSYVTLASFNQKDKLTHSGNYGITETVGTVSNWLDIDINYYARVNFTSLVDIVDAVGGISVNSEYAFTALGEYHFKAGANELNGNEALAFSRERYTIPGGDLARGQNQMRVIQGIINKMLSPAIITNYSSVLNAISGSFETSMTSKDISSLVKMQLNEMSGWTFETQQITGAGQTGLPCYSMPGWNQLYVLIPSEESVRAASQRIENLN